MILLDPDAAEQAESLRHRLSRLHTGGLTVIRLPDDLDPGECPREALWEFLVAEPAVQGVDLPGMRRFATGE